MEVTLTLDPEPVRRLVEHHFLRGLRNRARNFNPEWPAMRSILRAIERHVFVAEGQTEEHPPWVELSERYAEWKEKAYPGQSILQLTGRLYQQLTSLTGNPYQEDHPHEMTWGTNYPVGRKRIDLGLIHAEGRAAGPQSSSMPARPPIRITQTNCDTLADEAVDYLVHGTLQQWADAERIRRVT